MVLDFQESVTINCIFLYDRRSGATPVRHMPVAPDDQLLQLHLSNVSATPAMTRKNRSTPEPIQQISRQSSTLQTLRNRLAASQARLAVVQSLLPESLGNQLLPGGYCPETGRWAIVCPSHAGASKLRHFIPDMQAALAQADLDTRELRITVQTRI